MNSNLPSLDNIIDPDNYENAYFQNNNNNHKQNNVKIVKEEKRDIKEKEKNNKDLNIKENNNIGQINNRSQKKEIKEKDMIIIEENKNDLKNENIGNSGDNSLEKIIKELNDIKATGNDLYKRKLYDEAIIKYKEGYEIISEELLEVNRNRMAAYHPEIQYFISLAIHIMSNLSFLYLIKEQYKESIELDKKIISLDPKYDKSYERLFKCYLKLNQRAEAVFFGDILIKNFSNDIREKYKDLIPKIENEKKNMEVEYEIEKENKKVEARKNFLKFAIPFLIILISVIYIRFFKKYS